MLRIAAGFVVLIVYASLFPLRGWSMPDAPLFGFLFTLPARVEKADLVQNLLAYMPLGLFLVLRLMRSVPFARALTIATLAGGALSLAMEAMQQFIPSRVSSIVDLGLNLAGTAAGGLLVAFMSRETLSGTRLLALRHAWLHSGTLPNLGLATLALWVLAQTSPLVPTFDVGQLRRGLSLLYYTLRYPEHLVLIQAATYACHVAGLGVLARTLAREGKDSFAPFGLLVAGVLALKIVVEGRQLSLEAIVGAALAGLLLLALGRLAAQRALGALGIGLIGAGFVISELAARSGGPTYDFNWIPLAGQMRSLSGLQNMLEVFWPFFGMAYFARYLTPPGRRAGVAAAGALAVLAGVFLLEWLQLHLPGRRGDITQVALACAGWSLPWSFRSPDYVPAMRPML